MDLAQTIALSAGLAWASGLRLYLVVFLAGALAHLGYLHLPSTLAVLQHPLVIGVAGIIAFGQLGADKVPAFDSLWDSIQTFIRIPAGALLAAFALGEVDPAWMVAAGLIGGDATQAASSTMVKVPVRPRARGVMVAGNGWVARLVQPVGGWRWQV